MRTVRPDSNAADLFDLFLIFLFLGGFYLGVALNLPGGVPLPCVLSGLAAGIMLIRRAGDIKERHLVALLIVLTAFVLSMLAAEHYVLLRERFKGFIQLTYSLLIAYAFFLTAVRFDRNTLARIFLVFCCGILVGGFLENYTGFKSISDNFRARFFTFGVYESDIRDQLLYGRVRPKFLTSEPSAMTFAFTLFAFVWYALERSKLKLIGYVILVASGYFLMRGPTLFLGLALVPVFKVLIEARKGPPGRSRIEPSRAAGTLVLGGLVLVVAVVAGSVLYQERIQTVLSGQDASFFSRVLAPILTAYEVGKIHPFAGVGLTGWEALEDIVNQIYASTSMLAMNYRYDKVSSAVTNYFWLHWIFLGLFWGTVTLLALTFFLRVIGAPSTLFCWAVWAVFGQASGGYVDPRTWFPLLVAAAIATIYEREAWAEETGKWGSAVRVERARRRRYPQTLVANR
jgi:hypothetical protein